MSRLVHFTTSRAVGIARAVSGAPRATLAVVLVATIAFASVLPQLSLVNSEEMWIPEGPRADAYRSVAASMGATEYVGVLAEPQGGNIATSAALEAVLALQDAAVRNSSVAEAFRFPRDPGGNTISIADIVAEADAVLASRLSLFEPLAAALTATVNSTSGLPAQEAVAQAAAAAALLEEVRRSHGPGGSAPGSPLIETLVADLEVALLSGTDVSFKVAALSALLAATELAQWTTDNAGVAPSEAPLVAVRALATSAARILTSNASSSAKAAAAAVLELSVLGGRAFLDLGVGGSADADALANGTARGVALLGGAPPSAAYASSLAALARAVLFLDRLDPVAEQDAEDGLAEFSAALAGLLEAQAGAEVRAASVSIAARLFEAVVAMGGRGLDLAIPQTNVSYESYSVALNENATTLGLPSATRAARAQAATNLSLRTTAFLGNLVNLNMTGIFTDQVSFQRVLTMVTFLNDTFAELDRAMALPEPDAVVALPAAMVSAEILRVVNTTAPSHPDVNASSLLAPALRALEASIRSGAGSAGATALDGAAAVLLRVADFTADGLYPAALETYLGLYASALEGAQPILEGGDPPAAKAAFAECLSASLAGVRVLPHTLGNSARDLLSLMQDEVESLSALLAAGQSPALFARFANTSLSMFADGLADPAAFIPASALPQVLLFSGLVSPIPAVLESAAVTAATRDLIIVQAHVGASLVQSHLVAVPPPAVPRDRAEASARIHAMGDAAVGERMSILLNGTRAVDWERGLVPAGDPRYAPFTQAAAAYQPTLEDDLRAAFGYRAATLLPESVVLNGTSVRASGTVVLFLFNGSLDRPTLGAREAGLRDLARGLSAAVAFTAFGHGLMWYDTQRAMDLSVVLFALTMLAAMGAALWVVYRNAFDVLLTLGLLAATVVWVLGTAALVGIAVNPVTQVIPVLLIGLAEDYAVHITMGYRRRRREGAKPNAAVLAAVLGVGGVLFVATVTNGLSFLSFGGADIALIRDFGTMMALGLAYSFILTLTLIPAASVLHDRRRERRAAGDSSPPPAEAGEAKTREAPTPAPDGRTERGLLRVVHLSVGHPGSTLAIVALLTAAAALGATSLDTTFSYDQITATDLEVVRTLDEVQGSYGASVQRVMIEVIGPVDEPRVFFAMLEVAARAADDPYVTTAAGSAGLSSIASYIHDLALRTRLEGPSARGTSAAFADAFAAVDQNGNGGVDAGDSPSRAGLSSLYAAALSAPESTAAEFVGTSAGGAFDRAVLRVEARQAVEHGDALRAALEADAEPLRALDPPMESVTVTGLPLLNREVMQSVQDSGWRSVMITVAVALVVLTVFFFAAFRSVALGPLTIAPTLIAVAWTLGAMVLAGLSLDMMTVMIATTTIGMGDLYAIHISHSFYRELRRNKNPREAAASMVREAGAPLLEASATTALGFLILVFAPVPVIQSYGLIFAVSIVFAFLYSIIVMPVLVLLLARARHKVGVDAAA